VIEPTAGSEEPTAHDRDPAVMPGATPDAVMPGATPDAVMPGATPDAVIPGATPVAGTALRRPTFTIEGRAAPGLYFAGWILSFVGLTTLFVAIAATTGGPATVLLVLGGLTSTALGLTAGAGAQALQRRADGVPGYAGPSPFLVFAAGLVVSLLLSAAVSLTGVVEADTSVALVVSLFISTGVNLGLLALLVVGSGALTWAQMGIRRPAVGPLVGDIAWGLALGIVALLATGFLAALLVSLLGVIPEGPIPAPHGPLDRVLNVVAAVVIAPIGEEVFFRGFATTAWARRIGSRSAILRGALFFALVHVLTLGGSTASEAIRIATIAFVARLPVSYLLGWVFIRRGSLWASIALHATYNGTALLIAELAGRSVTGG